MMNDGGGGLSEMEFIIPDNPLSANENELSFITDSEDQPEIDTAAPKEVTSNDESMTEFKIQSVRGNYSNVTANVEKRKESTKKRRSRKAKKDSETPVPSALHEKSDKGACTENLAGGKVINEKSNVEGNESGEKVQQVDKQTKGRLKKAKVTVPKTKPPHKCNKCKRTFSDKRDRDRHMLRIHEGELII